MTKSRKPSAFLILFLAPAIIFYALFYLMPALLGVGLSFFSWDGLNPELKFIGLQNYQKMAGDPLFWNSVIVNLKAVAISLFTQLPLALLLGAILMRPGPGMKLFRALFFVPQMMSLVAVGMLWQMIFHPVTGLANEILHAVGLSGVDWLGKPDNALFSLLFVSTWTYFGFHMVLQMAGMSSIPAEIYEAVSMETNNLVQVFFKVTLPLLRETLTISTVMIITGSFAFLMSLFWVMTAGGPVHGTELMGIRLYIEAFKSYHLGYASAIAMVMLIGISILVALIVRWMSRERFEF